MIVEAREQRVVGVVAKPDRVWEVAGVASQSSDVRNKSMSRVLRILEIGGAVGVLVSRQFKRQGLTLDSSELGSGEVGFVEGFDILRKDLTPRRVEVRIVGFSWNGNRHGRGCDWDCDWDVVGSDDRVMRGIDRRLCGSVLGSELRKLGLCHALLLFGGLAGLVVVVRVGDCMVVLSLRRLLVVDVLDLLRFILPFLADNDRCTESVPFQEGSNWFSLTDLIVVETRVLCNDERVQLLAVDDESIRRALDLVLRLGGRGLDHYLTRRSGDCWKRGTGLRHSWDGELSGNIHGVTHDRILAHGEREDRGVKVRVDFVARNC